MRDDQVERVQRSFRIIQQHRTDFAALFYQTLFVTDPTAEALFQSTDMAALQTKLMATLEVIVANLYDLPKITGAILELGTRHTGYGVTKMHYDQAGEALLQTIGEILGPDFDDETRRSWQDAYDLVSFMMRSSSRI